jgi:glucose-1-phosphate adenylyltransferase
MSAATDLEDTTLTFILAGGEGERLYPLTSNQPTPVMPFGAIFRIIDFTLSNVHNSGLRYIYVLTQYKQEHLHSYVRHAWPQLCTEFWGDRAQEIVCLPPAGGKRYRGTADAVFQNLDLIEQSRAEYVLIVSGDQIYHMDYGNLLRRHAASGADLTIAAVEYPVEPTGSLGMIWTDPSDRAIGFEVKSISPWQSHSYPENALVSMGVYVFKRESLLDALRKTVDLNGADDFAKDVLPFLVDLGRAVVFRFDGYWRDIGTPDSYYQANLDLLLAGARLDPYENTTWPTRTLGGSKTLQRSWLASDSRVSQGAALTECEVWMSIVSTGARIDAGANLEAAVVLPGAHIGAGAKIRNAIIAEKAVIAPHARIGYEADADSAQFPVSENGIVIVGAYESRVLRTGRRGARVLPYLGKRMARNTRSSKRGTRKVHHLGKGTL